MCYPPSRLPLDVMWGVFSGAGKLWVTFLPSFTEVSIVYCCCFLAKILIWASHVLCVRVHSVFTVCLPCTLQVTLHVGFIGVLYIMYMCCVSVHTTGYSVLKGLTGRTSSGPGAVPAPRRFCRCGTRTGVVTTSSSRTRYYIIMEHTY